MPLRIVQLGSDRALDEGLRIGAVRRPPRGVPKTEWAARNWYDVWYPNLAPSVESMKMAHAAQASGAASEWAAFGRRFKSEMARPEASHSLNLLAALSHRTALSIGCYCADEARCHRSFLRALLAERGADIVPAST